MSKWHRWTQWNQSKCFGNAVDVTLHIKQQDDPDNLACKLPNRIHNVLLNRRAVVVNAKLIVTPDIDEAYLQGANSELFIRQASVNRLFVEQLTSQISEIENIDHQFERLTNRPASVRRALVEVGCGSSSIYPTYPRLSLNHPRLS